MYYYEHTNGTIIEKPDYVVDTWGPPEEYFDSPMCVRWWHEAERYPPKTKSPYRKD